MPWIERLRFTGSGNEAAVLAIRLARAFTGRKTIIVFADHYHGWAAGPSVSEDTLALDIAAEEALDDVLRQRTVAAVLVEANGACFGRQPLNPGMLETIRKRTEAVGTLMIVDEVLTGFRADAGGIQGMLGCYGDLTLLGKILGGGFPCGAVGGRADVMQLMTRAAKDSTVAQLGTHNAHPVSAAAGVVTLEAAQAERAATSAERQGSKLRTALNALFAAEGWPLRAAGGQAGFHLFPADDHETPSGQSVAAFGNRNPDWPGDLKLALAICGVHINSWPGGLLSSAHDDGCIEETVAAFAAALRLLGECARA